MIQCTVSVQLQPCVNLSASGVTRAGLQTHIFLRVFFRELTHPHGLPTVIWVNFLNTQKMKPWPYLGSFSLWRWSKQLPRGPSRQIGGLLFQSLIQTIIYVGRCVCGYGRIAIITIMFLCI